MILENKTVVVTGVGTGARTRGSQDRLARWSQRGDRRPQCFEAREDRLRTRLFGETHRSRRDRHHRHRLVRRPHGHGFGSLRRRRRGGSGGRTRHPLRFARNNFGGGLAGLDDYQRARYGGPGSFGGRTPAPPGRRIDRPDRLPIHVGPPCHAADRLRVGQGRPRIRDASHHPRTRPREDPYQHGDSHLDVGPPRGGLRPVAGQGSRRRRRRDRKRNHRAHAVGRDSGRRGRCRGRRLFLLGPVEDDHGQTLLVNAGELLR